ncbi:MAG: hypothetical protein R6W69_12335, partial [Anaerolineales bacterium]
REGYDASLDELRGVRDGARDFIAGLQARERERTGIGSLKVGFNRVFGYYLEVTRANLEKVPMGIRAACFDWPAWSGPVDCRAASYAYAYALRD